MSRIFQVPWKFRETIWILGAVVALLGVTLGGAHLLGIGEYVTESRYTVGYISLLFLLQGIILLGPLLGYTEWKYGLKLKYFGLKNIGVLRSIYSAIGGYALFLGITLIISIFILYTGLKIPGFQVQEDVLAVFGKDTLGLVVAGIIVVGIAPIFEEIFFRGFLLRNFANRMGMFWGSVMSAGVFALFHMQWQSIIPIFILGLIINSLVIRHKSIMPAIFFHVLNNGIAFTIEVLLITEVISLEQIV